MHSLAILFSILWRTLFWILTCFFNLSTVCHLRCLTHNRSKAQYSNPSSTGMKSLPLPAGGNKLTKLSHWRVARLLIKVVYKEVSSICDPTRAHGHQTQFKLVVSHRYLNWIFVCCWFIWTVGYQKWHECLTSSSRSAAMLHSKRP